MPLRRLHSMTQLALALSILPAFTISACAEGSNTPLGNNDGTGGEGGEWGSQSSSSSSSSGAGGGGMTSSSSSSSSSGGTSSSNGLVVLRVGDGSLALSGASAPVYAEFMQLDGTPTSGKPTIALPVFQSGNNMPFTLSGTATSEGHLSLSTNGKYVVTAGYAAESGTLSVNSTDASIYPRVVARIDATGNVDTTTTLGTAFTLSTVRGATTTDGVSIWVSGNGSATTGGVHYTTFGASSATQIVSAPNNARFVQAIAGQLYGSSGAGTYVNVFTIGSGFPTSSGQTATSLPGMPTTSGPSPYSFALVDHLPGISGVDTLYVADERSVSAGGGIQRWVFNGSSWTMQTNFGDGTSGVRGLTATLEGNGVRIIATTAEASMNRIISVFDDGSASPAITTISTSSANTVYRGIAFAPQ